MRRILWCIYLVIAFLTAAGLVGHGLLTMGESSYIVDGRPSLARLIFGGSFGVILGGLLFYHIVSRWRVLYWEEQLAMEVAFEAERLASKALPIAPLPIAPSPTLLQPPIIRRKWPKRKLFITLGIILLLWISWVFTQSHRYYLQVSNDTLYRIDRLTGKMWVVQQGKAVPIVEPP